MSYLKQFNQALAVGALTVGMGLFAGHAAYAGSLVLTGHDDDFHSAVTSSLEADPQAAGMIAFARAGSSNPLLPVLSAGRPLPRPCWQLQEWEPPR